MKDASLTPEVTYGLITWATEDPDSFKKFLVIYKAGGEPWEKLKAAIDRIYQEMQQK